MAFAFYVSDGVTTTYLSDGNPFKFESLEGISNAPVVRYEQRGPLQHGATDLGYRMGARTLQLNLIFSATTDAQLDTYRQTLTDAFAPSDSALTLYYERDDATTRTLDVYATGDLVIDFAPELRPGHTHRATLQLKAPNPLWLDQTVVQTTMTAALAQSTQWWLAGGAIASSVALEYGTAPAQGQLWTYGGNTGLRPLTIVWRTQESIFDNRYLFHISNSGTTQYYVRMANVSQYQAGSPEPSTFGFGGPSLDVHMWVFNGTALSNHYESGSVFVGSSSLAPYIDTAATARWRSNAAGNGNFWENAVSHYAVYDIALGSAQRTALYSHIVGTPTTFGTVELQAVNSGDAPAYPLIRLTGPFNGPLSFTNSTTGDSFSLGSVNIGSGDIYTIDLRDGNKQIYDTNGSSVLSLLTTPAALSGFRLEPNPIATGGTNTIVFVGNATSAASRVTVEHYDQYVSF